MIREDPRQRGGAAISMLPVSARWKLTGSIAIEAAPFQQRFGAESPSATPDVPPTSTRPFRPAPARQRGDFDTRQAENVRLLCRGHTQLEAEHARLPTVRETGVGERFAVGLGIRGGAAARILILGWPDEFMTGAAWTLVLRWPKHP
jgi:hypothetical protein